MTSYIESSHVRYYFIVFIIVFNFFRYNDNSTWPDIQLIIATAGDNDDGGLFNRKTNGLTDEAYAKVFDPILYKDAYTVVPLLLRPRSVGRIELRDKNPRSKPLIYPNYYDDPKDMKVVVRVVLINYAIFSAMV